MVKCLHKVHSKRIRPEPVDVKFKNAEQKKMFEQWLLLLLRGLQVVAPLGNFLSTLIVWWSICSKSKQLAVSNQRFAFSRVSSLELGGAGYVYWLWSQVCCSQCLTYKANSPEELYALGTCTIMYFLMHWEVGFYTGLLTQRDSGGWYC